jgi:hypothetical protein
MHSGRGAAAARRRRRPAHQNGGFRKKRRQGEDESEEVLDQGFRLLPATLSCDGARPSNHCVRQRRQLVAHELASLHRSPFELVRQLALLHSFMLGTVSF